MLVKINLKRENKLVQEGERVLEIVSAKASPSGKPTRLQLSMKDVEDGGTLLNNYNFDNSTSLWAMGVMLNIALGLEDGDDFDTKDVEKLVGIKLLCEVTHSEYNDRTYANVRRIISKVEEETGEVKEDAPVLDSNEVNEVLYGRNAIVQGEDDLS